MKLLGSVGLRIQFKPQGSLFLFAELPKDCLLSDVSISKCISLDFISILKRSS